MIEHLIDLAKLVIGVTVGSVIGSYIFEWRIKRVIKRQLPKIIDETAKKAKVPPKVQARITELENTLKALTEELETRKEIEHG